MKLRFVVLGGLLALAGRSEATVMRVSAEGFAVDLASGSVTPTTDSGEERAIANHPCDADTLHGRVTKSGSTLVFEQLTDHWNKRATLPSPLSTSDQVSWHAMIGNRLLVANEVRDRRYELDVHAFDLDTTREIWSLKTTRHGLLCTDLGHGRIGLDLADGEHAIDLATGRDAYKIPVPAAGPLSITNLGGERWLVVGDKALALFDGATGAVAWKNPIAGDQVRARIAVDKQLVIGLEQLDDAKTHTKFVIATYDLRTGAARRRAAIAKASFDAHWTRLDGIRAIDAGHVVVSIGTYAAVGP